MTIIRAAVALATVAILAACSAPATPPPTERPAGVAVHFTNTLTSGASAPKHLAAGSYTVTWDASDGDDTGCSFFLFLTSSVDGPTVAEITSAQFVDANGHTGSKTITVPATGAYLVQEDESGLSSCHRLWSADMTPQ